MVGRWWNQTSRLDSLVMISSILLVLAVKGYALDRCTVAVTDLQSNKAGNQDTKDVECRAASIADVSYYETVAV